MSVVARMLFIFWLLILRELMLRVRPQIFVRRASFPTSGWVRGKRGFPSEQLSPFRRADDQKVDVQLERKTRELAFHAARAFFEVLKGL
jgi:hypothetical protein